MPLCITFARQYALLLRAPCHFHSPLDRTTHTFQALSKLHPPLDLEFISFESLLHTFITRRMHVHGFPFTCKLLEYLRVRYAT